MKRFLILLMLGMLVMSAASGCRLLGWNRKGDACDGCADSCLGGGIFQGAPAIQALPSGPISNNRLEALPSP